MLQDSCTWAAGKSTAADVARYLTTGLYFSGKFLYDPNIWHYHDRYNPNIFWLTKFLNQHTDPDGDCMDVSDYLCICAHSQGLDFHVQRMNSSPDNPFHTNPGCPAGSDPSTSGESQGNYNPYDFAFHQPAFSGSGNVYDAAVAHKYDLSGNQYRNPPFNWPLSGYWQTPAPTGSTTDWDPLGLVAYAMDGYGNRLSNPATPHQLDSYTPDVL